MVSYGFLLEGKFIIIKLSGDIEKETLELFLQYLLQRQETSKVSKVLLYYVDAKLDISIDEISDFVNLRLDNLNVVKKLKTVHVVDSSFETAFAVLYSQRIPKDLADIAVCSTLFRAIQLLDIQFEEDELEEQIQNLAFSY